MSELFSLVVCVVQVFLIQTSYCLLQCCLLNLTNLPCLVLLPMPVCLLTPWSWPPGSSLSAPFHFLSPGLLLTFSPWPWLTMSAVWCYHTLKPAHMLMEMWWWLQPSLTYVKTPGAKNEHPLGPFIAWNLKTYNWFSVALVIFFNIGHCLSILDMDA